VLPIRGALRAKEGGDVQRRAAMTDPRFETALRLQYAGDLDAASGVLNDIIAADPRDCDALYLLGFIAIDRGALSEAERLIGQALALNPRFPDALYNHGRVLEMLGRNEEAIRAFDTLLALNPRVAKAWNLRGIALARLQRHDEALAAYGRALALDPNMMEAWANRGVAESNLGRFEDALASFSRNLALRPQNAEALVRHANALCALKHYEPAIAEYERALANDPDLPFVRGDRLHAKLHCGDWRSLEHDAAAIAAGIDAGKRVIQPGINLALAASAEAQLRCTRIWVDDTKTDAAPLPPAGPYRHDRLRVAYLSADFGDRVVANVSAGVFERHDRDRFDTVAIAFGADDGSPMRARLKRAFGQFVDVARETDRGVADLLRRMEIDVAVDMMGYTTHCRSGILALRPAPIQVNWLGYPGTMAAGHIDYILADATVIPEEHKRFYTEKVVWLPGCYLPYDSERRPAGHRPTRAEAGLPDTGFVFASFNNSYKFAPATFAVWMRLLGDFEDSVLWLPEHSPAFRANLTREAEALGIAPERLVFARYVGSADDHLARLAHADLFLDTAPYGAHSSAADALRAGVPVVTCPGGAFPGRVAASLLTAAGLTELIARDWAEYESLARDLARNPKMLAPSKARLADARMTVKLFDTAAFTRDLERAYATMVAMHEAGQAPDAFAVADGP
jgi:protein O-GlcNAc transferase